MNISGQHVLITGASGGVGKVAVENFLREGCKVTAQVNTNLSSLLPFLCDNLQVVQCDTRSEKGVLEFYEHAVNFGPVDILILNHGIFRSRDISMANMNLAEWNETLEINLTGSFLFARSFLRQVKNTPKIVIIGSTAGKYGEANHADYASSKSALQYGFTLSLKNEIVKHHPQGRVNAVGPGWIETPMAVQSMQNPDTKYAALASTPLRKIATAQEVVNTVLFLCSDLSSHITGQCIMVEGGMEGRVLNKPTEIA